MYKTPHRRPLALLLAITLLAFAGGCARQPPAEGGTQSALSGKRLRVRLTFATPLNPNYYYFFLMNVSNDKNAPGPIPVLSPISGQPYGNGFATGSTAGTGGFTDFVLFSDFQYPGSLARQGFGLYHVLQNSDANNRANFRAQGAPITFIRPPSDANDPNSTQIYFEIDLAQLFPDAATQLQAVNQALALQTMQVNVVATDIVPTEIQTTITKQFDSFGDTSNGRGDFLILNVALPDTITSGDIRAQSSSEPPFNDVFVSPVGSAPQNVSLNLKTWSIEIVQQ